MSSGNLRHEQASCRGQGCKNEHMLLPRNRLGCATYLGSGSETLGLKEVVTLSSLPTYRQNSQMAAPSLKERMRKYKPKS